MIRETGILQSLYNNEELQQMTIYQPYTYFMRWSKHDRQYYGVRYSQELNYRTPEEDLGHKYKSSSIYVKEFIEKNGEPDILYVDEKFNTAEEARAYEMNFLRENNVVNDDRWLNRTDSPGPPISAGEKNGMYGKKHTPEAIQKMKKYRQMRVISDDTKRKISEALLGRIVTDETRQKISDAHKGKKNSEESKQKQSQTMKGRYTGEKNPFYGKQHTKESRQLMSENNAMHRPEIREKCRGPRPSFMPHNHFTGWDDEIKQKISQSLLGHKHTDETKCKMRKSKANLMWVHKPQNKPIQIKKDLFDQYAADGWVRGRGPKKFW